MKKKNKEEEKSWTQFLTNGDINSYLAYRKLVDGEIESGKDLDCGINRRGSTKNNKTPRKL